MAVYMDTDKVQAVSKGFGAAADVIRAIDKALDVALNILKATAFVGLVGGGALIAYLERIQPDIDQLIVYCEEMRDDLELAVQKFIAGDEEGGSRFH